MPTILHKSPFYDRFTTVDVNGQRLRVFPYQVFVWVSLSRGGMRSLDPRAARFPAVLDSGFTDSFLIHKQQLRDFAGLQLEHLPAVNEHLRTHGRQIPLHDADVWIHRNQPGERDRLVGTPPFLLALDRGIGICGDRELYPRLPSLGARALRQGQLQVCMDYRRCQVSLRTPRTFWYFG